MKNVFTVISVVLIISIVPIISLLTSNNTEQDSHINNKPSNKTITTSTYNKNSNKTNKTDAKIDNSNEQNFFRIYDTSSKTVIEVSDKEFCCNALITQVEPDYPQEALKALAITIHTYYSYLRDKERENNNKYDFKCNSKIWNVYTSTEDIKGKWGDTFNESYSVFESIAKQVENKMMYYDNKICMTPFFEISSGTTNSYKDIYGTHIPYLVNTPSPFDATANNFKLITTISNKNFSTTLKSIVENYNEKNNNVSNIVKNDFGNVISLKIGDSKITGQEFTNSLKLRSSCFDIEKTDNGYNIITYGYGENIGLSKYGASQLAENGYKYNEILKYYFNGVEIR